MEIYNWLISRKINLTVLSIIFSFVAFARGFHARSIQVTYVRPRYPVYLAAKLQQELLSRERDRKYPMSVSCFLSYRPTNFHPNQFSRSQVK